MVKKVFRVMVALPLASAAGRKKLNGIHRFLSENHDWDLELVRKEQDFSEEVLADAGRNGFDGIIVGFLENRAFKCIHERTGIPSVFIDYPSGTLLKRFQASLFIHDDTDDIVNSAVGHLSACPGIRSYGFVSTRQPTRWSDDRRRAFLAALRARGCPVSSYDGPGASREDLERWLAALAKPAAVLAAFDDRARDVLEACRARSIAVPDQVSVLGIGNDEPICEMTAPQLSSIAVDFEQEGYRAARELQAMMLQRRGPRTRDLSCGVQEVVCRASTTASKTPGALVQRALAFIDAHALEGISASDVVGHLHMSKSLVNLRFREIAHTSVQEAIIARRLKAVKHFLHQTDLRMSEIAVRCGYTDASYLKNLFKARTGVSMRAYRIDSRRRPSA